jgi:hypothetical protein
VAEGDWQVAPLRRSFVQGIGIIAMLIFVGSVMFSACSPSTTGTLRGVVPDCANRAELLGKPFIVSLSFDRFNKSGDAALSVASDRLYADPSNGWQPSYRVEVPPGRYLVGGVPLTFGNLSAHTHRIKGTFTSDGVLVVSTDKTTRVHLYTCATEPVLQRVH